MLHRAPGAADWEQWPLERAMDRVAELVKKTRDETLKNPRCVFSIVQLKLARGACGHPSKRGSTGARPPRWLILSVFANAHRNPRARRLRADEGRTQDRERPVLARRSHRSQSSPATTMSTTAAISPTRPSQRSAIHHDSPTK